MRYKFRGRRVDNEEWMYGDLLHDRGLGGDVISDVVWIRTSNGRSYLALPKSVGQWTGRTDKKGVEIYEGDIVKCVSRLDIAHMIVLFEEGEFRMVLCEDYDSYTTGMGFYALRCFEKEVIGNIHDNPELMEVNNESY